MLCLFVLLICCVVVKLRCSFAGVSYGWFVGLFCCVVDLLFNVLLLRCVSVLLFCGLIGLLSFCCVDVLLCWLAVGCDVVLSR